MTKQKEKIEVFVGSGNVFRDTGHPNPEEALAKSELAIQIYKIIKSRKLKQKQAAKIMEIDQPKVSDIICGKLSRYSIDRLMRFLRLLGRDIEIRVKKHARKSIPSRLSVVGEQRRPSRRPRM